MNLNPFKNTYKIIEKTTLGGEKYYLVKYGNLFGREYLDNDPDSSLTCCCEEWGESCGKFTTLEKVKNKIEADIQRLAKERLNKTFSRTINYV